MIKFSSKMTEIERALTKERTLAAMKGAGGAIAISYHMLTPIGTINTVYGRGLMSAVFADKFANAYKGRISPVYTREYLRPDLKSWDWDRLDEWLLQQ